MLVFQVLLAHHQVRHNGKGLWLNEQTVAVLNDLINSSSLFRSNKDSYKLCVMLQGYDCREQVKDILANLDWLEISDETVK